MSDYKNYLQKSNYRCTVSSLVWLILKTRSEITYNPNLTHLQKKDLEPELLSELSKITIFGVDKVVNVYRDTLEGMYSVELRLFQIDNIPLLESIVPSPIKIERYDMPKVSVRTRVVTYLSDSAAKSMRVGDDFSFEAKMGSEHMHGHYSSDDFIFKFEDVTRTKPLAT